MPDHLAGVGQPEPPTDAALDRSDAFTAASEVVETWADDSEADPSDKAAHVRAVARTEFGRKGYEATTIRDIAAAAGLGTGTVYRVIGSKDELLDSIMRSFGRKVEAGWVGVLRSDATPVEKLDALSWVNVNALDQFSDEFRIQLAWMRQSPPTANPGWSYTTRLAADEIASLRRDPVGRDSDRRAIHRDVGALCHRAAVDTGEHPARRRQTHGAGACARHRPAWCRGPQQISASHNRTRY